MCTGFVWLGTGDHWVGLTNTTAKLAVPHSAMNFVASSCRRLAWPCDAARTGIGHVVIVVPGLNFQLKKLLGSPAQRILGVPEPTGDVPDHKSQTHTVSFLTDAHDEHLTKHKSPLLQNSRRTVVVEFLLLESNGRQSS